MSVGDANDRRSAPRQTVTLMVEYEDSDELVADFTENLSLGGTFIQTERVLEPGTPVQLQLSCPGLIDPIRLTGIVRWNRAASEGRYPGAGIEFSPYDQEVQARLEQVMTAIAERDPSVLGRIVDVLLVEDNVHVVNLLRDGLILSQDRIGKNVAFRFRIAGDGVSAVELIESQSFDAAIIDMYLPVLDGRQVIETIRKRSVTQFLPVIAISAGGRDAADAALDAGADRFLSKPVRLREIADALRALTGMAAAI